MEKTINGNEGGKTSIREFMEEWVSRDIDLCIGCNKCMDACPVSKEPFTIGELNYATETGSEVPDRIREFAFNCVQCGRCVPVCPAGARRDYMVLYIKHKLRRSRPKEYMNYLTVKGPGKHGMELVKQKLYSNFQKIKHRDLSGFMETIPSKKMKVLFYPGCYIYLPGVIRRTIKVLDQVGEPMNILGGLATCCGVPQLLQGDFDLADEYIDRLHAKIMTSEPEVVITGCAECLEALFRIKAKHGAEFEALTVVEYLLRHSEKFPLEKIRGKVTLHDSCRITRRYNRGEAAREALGYFTDFVEMKNSGEKTLCCYYWNMGYDDANEKNRKKRIGEAGDVAPVMACDCISCYERYKEAEGGVEVIDILELFEEAIEKWRG